MKHHCHGGSYKNRHDNVCLNDNALSQFDRPHSVDHIQSTELARETIILQIQYIIVLQILHKVNWLIVHITIIQTVQIIYILLFK